MFGRSRRITMGKGKKTLPGRKVGTVCLQEPFPAQKKGKGPEFPLIEKGNLV